eukprot:CAMPEP_0175126594 /NCGR_PEP_ID=MMETSP0087-20121206/3940_1 /TAXON_ID=136419 /ORGANISM="Unknown Unknown, Strain D1" /LENGTH=1418 /DNA_ID=CAMNT_0016408523 /DNA_START=130 /DNA_END=4386 /DNA_ORIENTATION=-
MSAVGIYDRGSKLSPVSSSPPRLAWQQDDVQVHRPKPIRPHRHMPDPESAADLQQPLFPVVEPMPASSGDDSIVNFEPKPRKHSGGKRDSENFSVFYDSLPNGSSKKAKRNCHNTVDDREALKGLVTNRPSSRQLSTFPRSPSFCFKKSDSRTTLPIHHLQSHIAQLDKPASLSVQHNEAVSKASSKDGFSPWTLVSSPSFQPSSSPSSSSPSPSLSPFSRTTTPGPPTPPPFSSGLEEEPCAKKCKKPTQEPDLAVSDTSAAGQRSATKWRIRSRSKSGSNNSDMMVSLPPPSLVNTSSSLALSQSCFGDSAPCSSLSSSCSSSPRLPSPLSSASSNTQHNSSSFAAPIKRRSQTGSHKFKSAARSPRSPARAVNFSVWPAAIGAKVSPKMKTHTTQAIAAAHARPFGSLLSLPDSQQGKSLKRRRCFSVSNLDACDSESRKARDVHSIAAESGLCRSLSPSISSSPLSNILGESNSLPAMPHSADAMLRPFSDTFQGSPIKVVEIKTEPSTTSKNNVSQLSVSVDNLSHLEEPLPSPEVYSARSAQPPGFGNSEDSSRRSQHTHASHTSLFPNQFDRRPPAPLPTLLCDNASIFQLADGSVIDNKEDKDGSDTEEEMNDNDITVAVEENVVDVSTSLSTATEAGTGTGTAEQKALFNPPAGRQPLTAEAAKSLPTFKQEDSVTRSWSDPFSLQSPAIQRSQSCMLSSSSSSSALNQANDQVPLTRTRSSVSVVSEDLSEECYNSDEGNRNRGGPSILNKNIQSPTSDREEYQHELPVLNKTSAIKRISANTLAELFAGDYSQRLSHFVVVDCRFKFEYNGGRIKGAVHACFKNQVQALYSECKRFITEQPQAKVAMIFHCEYSQERGPKACQFFQNMDRSQNHWPHLDFPEVYVLEGGYRKFFNDKLYGHCCSPNSYIEMWDTRFNNEMRRCMKANRACWAQPRGNKRDRRRKRVFCKKEADYWGPLGLPVTHVQNSQQTSPRKRKILARSISMDSDIFSTFQRAKTRAADGESVLSWAATAGTGTGAGVGAEVGAGAAAERPCSAFEPRSALSSLSSSPALSLFASAFTAPCSASSSPVCSTFQGGEVDILPSSRALPLSASAVSMGSSMVEQTSNHQQIGSRGCVSSGVIVGGMPLGPESRSQQKAMPLSPAAGSTNTNQQRHQQLQHSPSLSPVLPIPASCAGSPFPSSPVVATEASSVSLSSPVRLVQLEPHAKTQSVFSSPDTADSDVHVRSPRRPFAYSPVANPNFCSPSVNAISPTAEANNTPQAMQDHSVSLFAPNSERTEPLEERDANSYSGVQINSNLNQCFSPATSIRQMSLEIGPSPNYSNTHRNVSDLTPDQFPATGRLTNRLAGISDTDRNSRFGNNSNNTHNSAASWSRAKPNDPRLRRKKSATRISSNTNNSTQHSLAFR